MSALTTILDDRDLALQHLAHLVGELGRALNRYEQLRLTADELTTCTVHDELRRRRRRVAIDATELEGSIGRVAARI